MLSKILGMPCARNDRSLRYRSLVAFLSRGVFGAATGLPTRPSGIWTGPRAVPERSPEEARAMMSAMQRGWRRGRAGESAEGPDLPPNAAGQDRTQNPEEDT